MVHNRFLFSLILLTWSVVSYAGTTVNVDYLSYELNNSLSQAEVTGLSGFCPDTICIPATINVANKTYEVVSIAESAFYNSEDLTTLIIHSNNFHQIGATAFEACENLTTVDLKADSLNINYRAFLNCQALSSLTIDTRISTIYAQVFRQCYGLENVYVYWTTAQLAKVTTADDAFYNVSVGSVNLHVPTKDDYKDKSPWKNFNLVLDASVTTAPTANTLTYKADAQELVKTGVAANGTMYYSLNGISWDKNIPKGTYAGAYSVYYKVVANPGYYNSKVFGPVSVTINKAPLTITANSQTIVYGSQVVPYTVNYSGFKGSDNATSALTGTLTYDCKYDPVSNYNAGDYTITPSGSEATNYAITFVAGKLTINKAPLTITADDKTIVYGDQAPDYTYSYSGWKYNDGESALSSKPSISCTYQKTNDAGTYPITFSGNITAKNYTITCKNGTLTVNKAASKLTTLPTAAQNLTYAGTTQELVVAGAAEGGTMQYALPNQSYTNVIPKGTNAGKYTVHYKVAGDKNHTDLTPAPNLLEVNIAQASLTITADNKTINYGEKAPQYTASYQGFAIGDDLSKLSGVLVFACAYGEDNAAGTYPITPSGVSSDNYDISFKPGTLTVLKVAPTLIDAPSARANLTYNGSAQELVDAGSATGGTIKFTMDTTDTQSWKTYIPTATNADKYTVYYRLFGDKNHYDLPIDSVKAEIAKAVAKLSSHPKAKTLTYTGKDQVLIEAGVADGGTILYRLKDGEFAQALPQGTLAGNYTVHYKVVGDENHYDFMPDPDSLVARVNKASLAIRGDNKAIKYGDPEPAEYTASCTGWVNGEDQSVLHGTLTVTCGYHQWNNAGSYAIVPGGVTADNYAITFKNGTLTVKKAPLTITADDQTVTYGDPAPEYTASYSGWKGQDGPSVLGSSLLFICAYGAGNDAGTYDIQPHGAEATNYTFTYVNGTLTVDKATPEVTPPTAIEGLKYTGAAQTMITAGYTTGGTLEYALDEQDYSPVLPTATAVGTYTVYYRVNGGTNYNDVGSDSLMVTIAEPDEPTALAPVQAPVSQVQKIIRHDQLIIIRDDNTYTIHGQRID